MNIHSNYFKDWNLQAMLEEAVSRQTDRVWAKDLLLGTNVSIFCHRKMSSMDFFHQSKSFVKKSCLRDFEFWIPTNFWTGDFIFHWPYCAGRRGACRSRSRSFFSDKITRFGSWRTSSIKTKRQMKLHRFGYSWFMPQIFSLTSLKLCWLFLSLCFLLFYLQH